MLKLKRNREKGFTLIELLIVVAIIGIIAAILIPNLLDALQKAKQKRTISDVRNTGTSWMSWLTDQVSAASAGAAKKVYDASTHQTVTYPTLYLYLHPTSTFFYMQEVPQLDGWSNEMAWSQTTNLLHSNALAIYAKCRDNTFGEAVVGGVSPIIPFLATDYNHDIVWADGYMAQYPAGTKR